MSFEVRKSHKTKTINMTPPGAKVPPPLPLPDRNGVAALDALCRPKTTRGRRVARFSPPSPTDLTLFRAAMAGEHVISGFRNKDLTRRLYRRPPIDREAAHRRCERVSRLIVKLRGHGLVAKVPHAHLYRVTRYGQRVMTAALTIHDDSYPLHFLTPGA